ncbi:MAG: hypothetical protein ABR985_19190 [Methanotrichaceae archaeon]
MEATIIAAIIGGIFTIIGAIIGAIIKIYTPQYRAKITDPLNGKVVVNKIVVRGTINKELPESKYLWLLAGIDADNQWWPQGGDSIRPNNKKMVPAGDHRRISRYRQKASNSCNASRRRN